MKSPLFLALAVSLSVTPLLAQDAPPAAPAAPAAAEMPKWQQDYLNLGKEVRTEFETHLQKGRELFQQKRIFEAIEELKAAQKVFADSPDVENLLGACQVEFRAFDEALKHFERANELNPGNPSVLFNIAEVYFVTRQWAKSAEELKGVLAMVGDAPGQLQMRSLIEFKLMLSLIKLGKDEEALQLAEKYDFLDDTPFVYYAEAATAFKDGDEIAADASLARASRVFRDAGVLAPWQDTLMEFGYIKSFMGSVNEEAAESE